MGKAVTIQSIEFGMGTEIIHSVFGKHSKAALRAARHEVLRMEGLLSHFMPESEISKLNRSAGIKCERLSTDTYEVLWHAAEFSRCCRGLFDVTIGPLVNLWDYKNALDIPGEGKIEEVLPLVNYTDLILESHEKAAGLQKSGQSIDLGGIGKGFASDKFLEIFRKFDISSAFTNIGGNVAALGTKPDGSPWRVGIRHPRQEGRLMGAVSVTDKAVVTSGDYQRYFVDSKGKRYHHILDPATGYPSESGLISVTVVADSGMAADALSTILFVAGMKKGLEFLRSFPGAEAIFIDMDLLVHVTPGLKNFFQAEDEIRANIIDEWRG